MESLCHWVKQAAAVVCGLVAGLLPLTGPPGFVLFLAGVTGATFFTYSVYCRADLEELGQNGQFELIKEGFMPSLGGFILVWTLIYTMMHAPL